MTPHTPRLALFHTDVVHAAETAITGDFRCRGCAYQVTVYRTLPACPMCGGTSWRGRPARRFARHLPPGAAPGGRQAGGDRRAA